MIRISNHLIGLALVGQLALAGCADGGGGPEESPVVHSERPIEEVLEAHTDSLRALPGVVGTALGLCDDAPCIVVYLADSSAEARKRIPERLEGHPVRAEVSGEIRPRGS